MSQFDGSQIYKIRKALGMSRRQLAERMGCSVTAVASIEQGECNDTVTLASIRRAADALNCELEYSVQPRKEIPALRDEQARSKALKILQKAPSTKPIENIISDLKRTKRLWD